MNIKDVSRAPLEKEEFLFCCFLGLFIRFFLHVFGDELFWRRGGQKHFGLRSIGAFGIFPDKVL